MVTHSDCSNVIPALVPGNQRDLHGHLGRSVDVFSRRRLVQARRERLAMGITVMIRSGAYETTIDPNSSQDVYLSDRTERFVDAHLHHIRE